ncbi:MAG: UDP-N-acetylmuramoyl-L-alanyl-D-glutamate--2,6-diaminopimelate ligase [Ruminococcus sp.]|nr:UDP-N-acetylmuramoyl-L-alanyl-D-glutamate--2,6-diaminopimelate ligase [Candidatus Apopatosoma intestinale]
MDFGFPIVGITGTNGKTTTSLATAHLLRRLGYSVGTVGTIFSDDGHKRKEAAYTTPPPEELLPLLSRMRENNVDYCVMEVSSHALVQGRVADISFDLGIFTNLTRDHLDYHKTEEAYAAAKSKLFAASRTSLVNLDDPAARDMAWAAAGDVFYYGENENADFRIVSPRADRDGVSFTLDTGENRIPVRAGLVGSFQPYNLGAALAAVLLLCGRLPDEPFADFAPVTGRMERLDTGTDFDVYLDFAHTPDALEKALSSLRGICRGRLAVLFGCGGDRDRGKRPEMGKIASEAADFVYLTSDNPRSEDPDAILADIRAGIGKDNYEIIPDRRAAIERAIYERHPGDVLLLAGKGHEHDLIEQNGKREFRERDIVSEIIKKGKEQGK